MSFEVAQLYTAWKSWLELVLELDSQHVYIARQNGHAPEPIYATYEIISDVIRGRPELKIQPYFPGSPEVFTQLVDLAETVLDVNIYSTNNFGHNLMRRLINSEYRDDVRTIFNPVPLAIQRYSAIRNLTEPGDTTQIERWQCNFTFYTRRVITEPKYILNAARIEGDTDPDTGPAVVDVDAS